MVLGQAHRESKGFFTNKRILVKQIIDWSSKRIWAAITDAELYNTQNAFNLLPKSDLSLEYILALLNSKLMTYYHRKKFLDAFKMRFQKILIKDCRCFPIRTINFDDPADKEKHDRIVGMVEKMLALKQEHAAASAQMEDCRHPLADQITRMDKEIDALVYDLYGLTPEEIAVVEGQL